MISLNNIESLWLTLTCHPVVCSIFIFNLLLIVLVFLLWRKVALFEHTHPVHPKTSRDTNDKALLGRISGGVIHYMSQPLTVIHGYAQFLKEKIPASDANHFPITTIEEESAKLFQLVRDWMALIRHDGNQLISMNSLDELNKAVLFITDEVKMRHFTLKSEVDGSHFNVKSDPIGFQKLILTILWEILTVSGGKDISLNLREKQDEVTLSIFYSGIEIDAKRYLALLPALGITFQPILAQDKLTHVEHSQGITLVLKK